MIKGIILGNRILDIVFLSMFIAQMLKIFLPVFKGKRPKIYRAFETGGMPSSHTASVVSLCTCIGMVYGLSSPYFAISFVFAAVVIYDATGIRREAGRHAKMLNKIIFESNLDMLDSEEFKQFKEFLGHTPLEALAGGILGMAVPFILRGYLI